MSEQVSNVITRVIPRETVHLLHETETAGLEAFYSDTALLDQVRQAVIEAEQEGTATWPTLDDMQRVYGLHDDD